MNNNLLTMLAVIDAIAPNGLGSAPFYTPSRKPPKDPQPSPASQGDALDVAFEALQSQKAVAWARPVFATEAVEPFDKGELVDVEFYNHPERPEGEGWRPLIFADTDDARATRAPADSVLEDTARLDWLDEDAGKHVTRVGKIWYTHHTYGHPYRKHKNLRAAIDAARKQGEKP